MLTGVYKNLTFADGGRGGVQNGLKNADVINESKIWLKKIDKKYDGQTKILIKKIVPKKFVKNFQ